MHPEDCVQTIVNMYNMQDSNNTFHSRKSIMYLIHSLSHTYSQRHSELLALHENVNVSVSIKPIIMWVQPEFGSTVGSVVSHYVTAHDTELMHISQLLQLLTIHCVSPFIFLSSPPLSNHWPCSNRSRTPPTCTSPTCRCLWTSRSWRTCWSPWVTSSPRGYWGMPTGSAEESASPGTQ